MHYIIVNDWANDSNCECGVRIVGIAHGEAAAQKIFDAHVQELKDIAEEKSWIIYNDTDTEFDSGESDFYMGNHERLYIEMIACEDE